MVQSMGAVARAFSPEFEKAPVTSLLNTSTALLGGEFEYADLTATSTAVLNGNGDFMVGMNNFRCVVNAKTFAAGTTHTAFYIECADDAGFTVNVRRVAHVVLPLAAGPWSFVMLGFAPDGSKRYARVAVVLGASATCTFDAFLSACP